MGQPTEHQASNIPLSVLTSRQTLIALLTFFIASRFVRPWLTHPEN
jgi:hypothetical protein